MLGHKAPPKTKRALMLTQIQRQDPLPPTRANESFKALARPISIESCAHFTTNTPAGAVVSKLGRPHLLAS